MQAEAGERLFPTNALGTPLPPLQIPEFDISDWVIWEGLAFIPLDAPAFGGAIVGLGHRNTDYPLKARDAAGARPTAPAGSACGSS